MGLTLAKGEDPRKLGTRIAIIQSRFKLQVEEKDKMLAVVNAGGFRYADAIGQEHQLCEIKLEPVTARKLIKGESFYQDVEARKVETVLSVSEAKKCYHRGETGHMAFKCSHKKNGFSAKNGQFACHFCDGIGHKHAKC